MTKFAVITHVVHRPHEGKYFAYGPYVKEMNLWLKYTDEFILVAPQSAEKPTAIDLAYIKSPVHYRVPSFNITSVGEMLKTLVKLPVVFYKTWLAMRRADHIHLRLPGNMGLVGSMVQMFFPGKPKTIKYAGNWDPKSKQPWSYRLQQKIVSNPRLTKNIKVLVYGEWPDQSKNIVPFFTASYTEKEIEEIETKDLDFPVRLIFVGALSAGKQPLVALKVLQELLERKIEARMDFYGDGDQRPVLEAYIRENRLENHVTLHGKQSAGTVKNAYRKAHFLIFPSLSEGWPKVVMEAMTWKCLPVTTGVSAVPYMLGNGKRGSIVRPEPELMAEEIVRYLDNPGEYKRKTEAGFRWAKQFTLEKFEAEIRKFLED